jgi:hypothetical protein
VVNERDHEVPLNGLTCPARAHADWGGRSRTIHVKSSSSSSHPFHLSLSLSLSLSLRPCPGGRRNLGSRNPLPHHRRNSSIQLPPPHRHPGAFSLPRALREEIRATRLGFQNSLPALDSASIRAQAPQSGEEPLPYSLLTNDL